MGFDTLLGNDRLKNNLIASLSRGRISHFYLICGPKGSGKHTLARLLAAAIECEDKDAPCLNCSACRKILSGNHPDFITVEDKEHKHVAVRIVREARADMYVMPNEGKKKIYLFPQELGIEGQNALLKILEEPPQYGVFLLLTENPEQVLPTVRSRCTELSLTALPENILTRELEKRFPQTEPEVRLAAAQRSGGFLGQAIDLLEQGQHTSPQTQNFLDAFAHKNPLALVQTLVPMEKWKREQLIEELQSWQQELYQALLGRNGVRILSPAAREVGSLRNSQDVMHAIESIRKGIEYAQGNISVAAICGWLSWALR